MEVKEAVYGRRSVRNYLSKPVGKELIQEIIEGACMAPSAANQQPWYFLAISNEVERNKCLQYMGESFKTYQPSLEKRFGGNSPVIKETGTFFNTLGGAPVVVLAFLLKKDYPDIIYSSMSTAAAIENLLLLAYDKGLASCWLTVPDEAGTGEQMRAEFAPDKGKLLGVITLGYSEQVVEAASRRAGRFEIR